MGQKTMTQVHKPLLTLLRSSSTSQAWLDVRRSWLGENKQGSSRSRQPHFQLTKLGDKFTLNCKARHQNGCSTWCLHACQQAPQMVMIVLVSITFSGPMVTYLVDFLTIKCHRRATFLPLYMTNIILTHIYPSFTHSLFLRWGFQ